MATNTKINNKLPELNFEEVLPSLTFDKELPLLNFTNVRSPSEQPLEGNMPQQSVSSVSNNISALPELTFNSPPAIKQPNGIPQQDSVNVPQEPVGGTKLEKPESFLTNAIAPIKRVPEVYKKEVSEGVEQIKQPGLLNRTFGALRLGFSPLTAPIEALIGEPVEKAATAAGASEEKVQFLRGLAEGAAYMTTPGKAVLGKFAKVSKDITATKKGIEAGIRAEKAAKGFQIKKFMKERRADIDIENLRSDKFIVERIEQKLTKLEREALPFLRQKIKDPKVLEKIGRPDLVEILKNPSKQLQKTTKEVGDYFDEAHAFLAEHGNDVNYIEDYVTQLWDIPSNKKNKIVNYFVTKNPFGKKRTIPTLEEGIKLGLKPKTTDIAKLVKIYDDLKIKTSFNLKFADNVKSMVDDTGQSLLQATGKAPKGWVVIDHPALRKTVFRGKFGKVGESEKILLENSRISVHPEIANEMKAIFGKRFAGKDLKIPGTDKTINLVPALETINAFAKKSMLSGSFFHHFALTESAFSSGIGRKAIQMWNPVKIYKALKNKDYDIFKKMPLAEDAIRKGGVTFTPLADVQLGIVNKAIAGLEKATKNIPVVGKGVKLARKGNDLWDRALWDYYHNNLKLYAYEEQLGKELKKINPKDLAGVDKIKAQVGGFVNDSFGGQQWEQSELFGDPKMQQIMQWALLAPDWTVSTLKQAAAPITGLAKGNAAQITVGTKFWIKAALYNTILVQSVNYYNTKKEYGEGKFSWDNDPGHKADIFIGFNDDGTKRYLKTGKQFKESVEWMMNPIKKFGGKLSPAVKEAYKQLGAVDPGSGFPAEFKDKEGLENILGRAKSIALNVVPISLKAHLTKNAAKNFMFTFPTSKGMTRFKTVKLFKKALEDKDIKQIKKVYISAVENGLDAQSHFRTARSAVKSDLTYEDKDIARDIINEMKGMTSEAKKDLLVVYKKKGLLTENIAKQFRRLIEEKDRIEEQKKLIKKLK